MTFVFSLAECERRTQTITLPNQSNADGPVLMSPPGLIPDSFSIPFHLLPPMPKSTSASPPASTGSSKAPQELGNPNLLCKKKNANSQAAFRARRQNYISTLKETGIPHSRFTTSH